MKPSFSSMATSRLAIAVLATLTIAATLSTPAHAANTPLLRANRNRDQSKNQNDVEIPEATDDPTKDLLLSHQDVEFDDEDERYLLEEGGSNETVVETTETTEDSLGTNIFDHRRGKGSKGSKGKRRYYGKGKGNYGKGKGGYYGKGKGGDYYGKGKGSSHYPVTYPYAAYPYQYYSYYPVQQGKGKGGGGGCSARCPAYGRKRKKCLKKCNGGGKKKYKKKRGRGRGKGRGRGRGRGKGKGRGQGKGKGFWRPQPKQHYPHYSYCDECCANPVQYCELMHWDEIVCYQKQYNCDCLIPDGREPPDDKEWYGCDEYCHAPDRCWEIFWPDDLHRCSKWELICGPKCPSASPSSSPTNAPTASPTTSPPTKPPTPVPTIPAPTSRPSVAPSSTPFVSPSARPTLEFSDTPSSTPTSEPTSKPSNLPSSRPTTAPSFSVAPTAFPSFNPSYSNDMCKNAEEIKYGECVFGDTLPPATIDDVRDITEPEIPFNGCTDENGKFIEINSPGVWYTFKAQKQMAVAAACNDHKNSTGKTSWYTKFSVYTGTSCDKLICEIGAEPQEGVCDGTGLILDIETKTNLQYWILVHGGGPVPHLTIEHFKLSLFGETHSPSIHPSDSPTSVPSLAPTSTPSVAPTAKPSVMLSDIPSSLPSQEPSHLTSSEPSNIPSEFPSLEPSEVPSDQPSDEPSQFPSLEPSEVPSDQPSDEPSQVPSLMPSEVPSNFPSLMPSDSPTAVNGSAAWVFSGTNESCSSACADFEDAEIPQAGCNAEAQTAVDSNETISYVTGLLGVACNNFGSFNEEFRPTINGNFCVSQTPNGTDSTCDSTFENGPRICCCAESRDRCPTTDWRYGDPGESCTDTCGREGGACNAEAMFNINNEDAFLSVADTLGISCASGLQGDTGAGTAQLNPRVLSGGNGACRYSSPLQNQPSPQQKCDGTPGGDPAARRMCCCGDVCPFYVRPSTMPSSMPSTVPSDLPSSEPSNIPSEFPSLEPSEVPSDQPSDEPSQFPSLEPSEVPSDQPSDEPSQVPSLMPSEVPSNFPSLMPSDSPTAVNGSAAWVFSGTNESCSSACADFEDAEIPQAGCNAEAQTAVDSNETISYVTGLLGVTCNNFGSFNEEFRPTINGNFCVSQTPNGTDSTCDSTFENGPRICCCAESRDRCPTTDWRYGDPGESCTDTCGREGGACNAEAMFNINNEDAFLSVADTLGISCASGLQGDTGAGTAQLNPRVLSGGNGACRYSSPLQNQPSPQQKCDGTPGGDPAARRMCCCGDVCPFYVRPSTMPSSMPSTVPSDLPSSEPSNIPSEFPSLEPSEVPSDQPSDEPSQFPSLEPSEVPSDQPSDEPSQVPSLMPSSMPSTVPSDLPSSEPSNIPSEFPSLEPSEVPSDQPSDEPSQFPSLEPSEVPSDQPSDEPSQVPSLMPSEVPSNFPSLMPSDSPTAVNGSAAWVFSGTNESCSSACADFEDAEIPQAGCNAEAQTAVDSNETISYVTGLLGVTCNNFGSFNEEFRPTINGNFCVSQTPNGTDSTCDSTFENGPRICCCAESRDRCPTTDWRYGDPGESCTDTCGREGGACNAEAMFNINNEDAFLSVADTLGISCASGLQGDTGAGTAQLNPRVLSGGNGACRYSSPLQNQPSPQQKCDGTPGGDPAARRMCCCGDVCPFYVRPSTMPSSMPSTVPSDLPSSEPSNIPSEFPT